MKWMGWDGMGWDYLCHSCETNPSSSSSSSSSAHETLSPVFSSSAEFDLQPMFHEHDWHHSVRDGMVGDELKSEETQE